MLVPTLVPNVGAGIGADSRRRSRRNVYMHTHNRRQESAPESGTSTVPEVGREYGAGDRCLEGGGSRRPNPLTPPSGK